MIHVNISAIEPVPLSHPVLSAKVQTLLSMGPSHSLALRLELAFQLLACEEAEAVRGIERLYSAFKDLRRAVRSRRRDYLQTGLS